ncbi:putative glycolipid-binding domain-containing protein [Mesorhizobium sp.]|uniref:putative glycolipid-binding domain-containing protein n=1 Tax=Mesorhizobium sp. TaxID=1871066 RepID=UPI00257A2C24|nr:putative glycolipid-binding domain-containing protein [Mesorhizobium sp.]
MNNASRGESMSLLAIWRRTDEPGHDVVQLKQTDVGWHLNGAAVYLSDAGPARLDYTVQLAEDWTTKSGTVRGFIGSQSVDLTIIHNVTGVRSETGIRNETGWTVNGQRQPAVQSMVDLDYSFTPATNLQQIRRMNLKVGDKADFPVAWLVAGASSLVVLPQIYHRVSETEYIYEAPTVPYRATLLIPEAGFAQDYPDGWVFETGNAGRAL